MPYYINDSTGKVEFSLMGSKEIMEARNVYMSEREAKAALAAERLKAQNEAAAVSLAAAEEQFAGRLKDGLVTQDEIIQLWRKANAA